MTYSEYRPPIEGGIFFVLASLRKHACKPSKPGKQSKQSDVQSTAQSGVQSTAQSGVQSTAQKNRKPRAETPGLEGQLSVNNWFTIKDYLAKDSCQRQADKSVSSTLASAFHPKTLLALVGSAQTCSISPSRRPTIL